MSSEAKICGLWRVWRSGEERQSRGRQWSSDKYVAVRSATSSIGMKWPDGSTRTQVCARNGNLCSFNIVQRSCSVVSGPVRERNHEFLSARATFLTTLSRVFHKVWLRMLAASARCWMSSLVSGVIHVLYSVGALTEKQLCAAWVQWFIQVS